MKLTRLGLRVGAFLMVLGLIEVVLRIYYCESIWYGLSFSINDPGKIVGHIILFPFACAILVSRLPFSVLRESLLVYKYVGLALFLIIESKAIMQLYEESESGYYFKDPMPYEVKGATAEMVVLRYTIANRIAAYYQSLSHDQKDWQEIQQLKATYSQQIGKLKGTPGDFLKTSTIRPLYGIFLSCVGAGYVTLLFVLLVIIIAGRVKLNDSMIDAFIFNVLILSPWLILRPYSEWYLSMDNYNIQQDLQVLNNFFMSITLVLLIALIRKGKFFLRTFAIGAILLLGTGVFNLLLNPRRVPDFIYLVLGLTSTNLLSLFITFFASACFLVWNKIYQFPAQPIPFSTPTEQVPMETSLQLELSLEQQEMRPDEAVAVPEKASWLELSDELIREYTHKLTRYFEQQKPYLDPGLAIKKVADQLGMPLHHLSWLLNEHLGHTFPDYVNGFRVAEAKRRLRDPQSAKIKIETIGYECGFNSKATFNRVFKKHTDLSPSQYQKASDSKFLIE